MSRRFVVRCLGLALACLLAAPLRAGTRELDTTRSVFNIRVLKSGLFSAFGHEHQVQAPLASGTIQDSGALGVEVTVDARRLRVLDPDRPAQERAEVQETMLGPKVLDSERYPEIRFRSVGVEPLGEGRWRVRGELTLHGQARRLAIEVNYQQGAYRGNAEIRQTDYGITPVRVGGGTVKVKDQVRVEFELYLR